MAQKEETINLTNAFFDGQDIDDLILDKQESSAAPPV